MNSKNFIFIVVSFIIFTQSQPGYAMRRFDPNSNSSVGKSSDAEEIRRIAQELQFEVEAQPSQGNLGAHNPQFQTSFHLPNPHFVNPFSGMQQLQTLGSHPSTQPYSQWGSSSFGASSFGATHSNFLNFNTSHFNPFSPSPYFASTNLAAPQTFLTNASLRTTSATHSSYSSNHSVIQPEATEPVSKRASLEQANPSTVPSDLTKDELIQKLEGILIKHKLETFFPNVTKLVDKAYEVSSSKSISGNFDDLSQLLKSLTRLGSQTQNALNELGPYKDFLRNRILSSAIEGEDIPSEVKALFKGICLRYKLSQIRDSIAAFKKIVDDVNTFCKGSESAPINTIELSYLKQRISKFGLKDIHDQLDPIRSSLSDHLEKCIQSRVLALSKNKESLLSTENFQQSMQLALNPAVPSCSSSTQSASVTQIQFFSPVAKAIEAEANINRLNFALELQESDPSDLDLIYLQNAFKDKISSIQSHINDFLASSPETLKEAERAAHGPLSSMYHKSLKDLSHRAKADNDLLRFQRQAHFLIREKLKALTETFEKGTKTK